jgi:arylsulfatase A-like enzyme
MSRQGDFEEFTGDSSEIIVSEALKFIANQAKSKQPFFTVIWYGTPHSPWVAADADKTDFAELNANSQNHYGELVAMDRSIGALRQGLRQLKIEENTLFWFCSDNGGLPKISPGTVGGLRGFKGSVFEGGLRVPAIIEWPKGISTPRVTSYPACTMDVFSTLAQVAGIPDSAMLQPQDGTSLVPLFHKDLKRRETPIGFRHTGRAALIDNNYKLITLNIKKDQFQLFDLDKDSGEEHDISKEQPNVARRMKAAFQRWNQSVEASVAGKDYPEGTVSPSEPKPRFWTAVKEYEPYFEAWARRPEYKSRLK